MSRQIKFRVRDLEENAWGIEDYLKSSDGKLSYIIKEGKPELYTIQQFTGLLDKNGREIYEGDYVSFWVKGAAHGRERESYQNQEVHYDQELACFMFGKNYGQNGGYWGHCMLDEIDKKTLEVVGNIFEK